MEWEAVPNSFSKQVLTLKRLILVIIGSAICGSLFFGCQKSSSSNSDQATLYALLGQANYSCAKVTANTTSAQSVSFSASTSGFGYIGYVKVVAAAGQKLIFASTTTNIASNFTAYSVTSCGLAASNSPPFTVTTNTSTNYTITFSQAFTGVIEPFYNTSSPTDITVQQQ
ncbi:hypothetical protein LEP1GSC050_1805 [Leptospira broomii serovar Hurstbridge str. 5399]|uniref:Uncharacterized protein n=2 Tax=Leptospira broomii TaxID=301541 RepID=T0F856_9LEPT|nr:hypothetical protein LEP1GSC050_1805 [Leptospira broomii serovar Hurstbridge str. 5399]